MRHASMTSVYAQFPGPIHSRRSRIKVSTGSPTSAPAYSNGPLVGMGFDQDDVATSVSGHGNILRARRRRARVATPRAPRDPGVRGPGDGAVRDASTRSPARGRRAGAVRVARAERPDAASVTSPSFLASCTGSRCGLAPDTAATLQTIQSAGVRVEVDPPRPASRARLPSRVDFAPARSSTW